MAMRTSYRRNNDGSYTKTTTYSRKTILGNRRTESVRQRISADDYARMKKTEGKIWKAVGIAFVVLIVIGLLVK